MLDFRFDAPLECDGQWRLGEIGGNGRLRYQPDTGLSLTFVGPEKKLEYHLALDRGPLVITGRTSSPLRKDVTLEGCYLTQRTSSDNQTTATFLVNRAFFGSCSGSNVTQGLRSISATMTALEEWVSPAGPFLETKRRRRGSSHEQFEVYLDEPRDVEFACHDASIALRTVITGSASRTAASFEARSLFVINALQPQLFDDMLARFIRPLENFVTLGTGRINSLRTLSFERETVASEVESVDVLFRAVQGKARRSEWLTWPRGLFSQLDIQDSLAERVSNWLTVYARYRTVCDQMFYTIYNHQYLESYFLWVVQTIEGYHRLRGDLTQHRLQREEYRSLIHAAADAVPSERRELFLQATQHGHEVSLKGRLVEMVKRYGHLIPAVLTDEERLTFPARCAFARNAIAHHLMSDEALNLEQLHKFADFALRLLAAALMRESGFEEAEVLRAMRDGASLFRKKDPGP